MRDTMEKQIAQAKALIEQGATPQDVRDLGFAHGAVREATKRVRAEK